MIDISKYLPNSKLTKINDLYENNKGYDIEYIKCLVDNKLDLLVMAFEKARTKEEYIILFKELLINNKISYLPKSIVNYETYKVLFNDKEYITADLALKYLNNDIKKEDSIELFNMYKTALFDYINDNNFIKNSFNNYDGTMEFVLADYTKPFTREILEKYYKDLFVYNNGSSKKDNNIRHNQSIMADLLFKLFTVYDKDTLFNNRELVIFELSRGYFDEYYINIENDLKIPDIRERMANYDKEKNIPKDVLYILKDIDLLRDRINSLDDDNKTYYLDQLEFIPFLKDTTQIVNIINLCLTYYEYTYRKEIIASLYDANDIVEVTDYKELKPLMVHVIIRDPIERFYDGIKNKIKNDIFKERKIRVTKEDKLTDKEFKQYKKREEYALSVLLNPFVTDKYVKMKTIHTGKNDKGRWYRSDTSEQLSASLYSPEFLLNMDNCIGVGFDSNSLKIENIALSANTYITTNKGLNNLEILPSKRFKVLSSPLGELSKHQKTELILFRNKNNSPLKSAYVFVAVNGINLEEDNEMINKGREYANANNLPLKVFRIDLLKKSYEEQLRNSRTK